MILSLIHFNRSKEILPQPDLGEKVANACMGYLRLGCGKTIKVTTDSQAANGLEFHAKNRSLLIRISAVVFAVLLLPVTLLLAGVGCIGLACSNTHSTLFAKYSEQRQALEDSTKKAKGGSSASGPTYTYDPLLDGEPVKKKKPAPFTRKFHRASCNIQKHMVGAAIKHLKLQDPMMTKILDTWLIFEKQQRKKNSLGLIDAMTSGLQRGTCYGQALNILELLGSKDRSEVTEEYVAKSMTWEHYAYYQIVHVLHVFMQNLQGQAHLYGINAGEAIKKLESLFPHSEKKMVSSPKMKLNRLTPDSLAIELSDFVKVHIRPSDSAGEQRDYAVMVTLMGYKGHAAILYYSETQKQYFWYDPFSPDYGFFSSDQAGEFFRGVAKKLIKYQKSKLDGHRLFTEIYFEAYKLQS